NDFENAYQQAIALDRRLNENGNRVYSLAKLSAANQQFDIAKKAYEYVISKGNQTFLYAQARVELLQLDYMLLTSSGKPNSEQITELEIRFRDALNDLGKNRNTIALIQNLANLLAFHQHNAQEAIALLHEALTLPGIDPRTLAGCKFDLADIYLYSGDVWEAILFYARVERLFPNDPLGHESKFRNARLWYMIGEFEWASAQLEVLKASTSQLIANDAMALWLLINDHKENDTTFEALSVYARADMHLFRNHDDLALLTLDSLTTQFPNHSIIGHALMKKAGIMENRREYTEAARMLEMVTEAFGFGLLADKALFKLATLYEKHLDDTEKAMQLYKRLLVEFPASIYATPARQQFRLLRGDPL
ncbi:MAG TPA: tetratricopeptide repeat protein, partial [Bacteroidales bacterium]|nr:tetratricopeptide repeat protein [Bacteroidales bacterium]